MFQEYAQYSKADGEIRYELTQKNLRIMNRYNELLQENQKQY